MRHGVEFTCGGIGIMHPVFGFGQGRLGGAGGFEVVKLGKAYGKLAGIEGAVVSIFPNNGKGFAPVTLARKKPVAEFVLDSGSTERAFFEPCGDFAFGICGGKSGEGAGVNGDAFACKAGGGRGLWNGVDNGRDACSPWDYSSWGEFF